MTLREAYLKMLHDISSIYDDREATNIADWVFENVTGKKKVDRIIYKDFPIGNEQVKKLENYVQQLLQHKPVQYVLHEAWFAGMKLYVDEAVLIPRPETEELVEWIVSEVQNSKFEIRNRNIGVEKFSDIGFENSDFSILDVGTGSGCIALGLKRLLPGAKVSAIDLSDNALSVAKKNAAIHALDINFLQVDFLDKEHWKPLALYDIIVSNPPYVVKSEAINMNRNVVDHEPHLALFVPEEDPLIFYTALAEFAQLHLKMNGSLYVEINAALGQQVVELFAAYHFKNIILKKDLQGRDRMVRFDCPNDN